MTELLVALALDGQYTTGRPPFCLFIIGVDVRRVFFLFLCIDYSR
jgi:hypothetical protein